MTDKNGKDKKQQEGRGSDPYFIPTVPQWIDFSNLGGRKSIGDRFFDNIPDESLSAWKSPRLRSPPTAFPIPPPEQRIRRPSTLAETMMEEKKAELGRIKRREVPPPRVLLNATTLVPSPLKMEAGKKTGLMAIKRGEVPPPRALLNATTIASSPLKMGEGKKTGLNATTIAPSPLKMGEGKTTGLMAIKRGEVPAARVLPKSPAARPFSISRPVVRLQPVQVSRVPSRVKSPVVEQSSKAVVKAPAPSGMIRQGLTRVLSFMAPTISSQAKRVPQRNQSTLRGSRDVSELKKPRK